MISTSNSGLSNSSPKESIQALADKIIKMRLEFPAILFLEMHLPLTTLMYNASLFFSPILSPVIGSDKLESFSQLLSERENVQELLRILKLSQEG